MIEVLGGIAGAILMLAIAVILARVPTKKIKVIQKLEDEVTYGR